jgi:bifunctional DNA primase/polymerase-like protein
MTIDFVAIATPLVERGFRVTPVHPETKMGVMKNWQNFQLTTIDDVRKYAKYFPHHNVGVVGKRGAGPHGFLDVDAAGLVERIENENQHEMPKGYRVKSSPTSKPYKTHFYFKQTPYSFEKFGGWKAVNSNVKDMTTLDEEGKHPTLYDLKGVGGGSLVVGAGSVKQTGEVYTCVDDGPVPEIPNWLVDWLVRNIDKYWDTVDAEKAAKLARKEAEQEKYTPSEREAMRRKNLPEGFDIYFEDRYAYLCWRAFKLSSMGLRKKSLEVALTELAENDIAGGKEYVQTDKGKSLIHKLANNPSLEPGNGSWFYRTKEKRPKRTTPTVSTISDRRPIIIKRKPQTRREAMVEIVKGFPDRLHRTEAYDRIEAGLARRFPFNRTDNTCRKDITRARKDAAFSLDGHWWVRQK